jgi:hypothetical protein
MNVSCAVAATAALHGESMHAAHEIDAPDSAHAVFGTPELLDAWRR